MLATSAIGSGSCSGGARSVVFPFSRYLPCCVLRFTVLQVCATRGRSLWLAVTSLGKLRPRTAKGSGNPC
ncbi:hypothetical protein Enr8_23670 [Blastopirellula retiformator]|uniref:Uncharacterized protein n=1 Tax=Blastopirellula retiformator TaxID=2527970 RepID=A0A5C5V9I7_9BACT|nr:hypothetical protein Enr8_23670 [Blastopirellula retiformator]